MERVMDAELTDHLGYQQAQSPITTKRHFPNEEPARTVICTHGDLPPDPKRGAGLDEYLQLVVAPVSCLSHAASTLPVYVHENGRAVRL